MTLPPANALQSEEDVLSRLRKQQLIESREQMSPVWTKARLSEEGIEMMRTWGISA